MLFLALLPACGDAQLMICQEFSAYAKDPLQAESLLEAAHQYSPEALTRSVSTPSPQIPLSRDCSSENHLLTKPHNENAVLHIRTSSKFLQGLRRARAGSCALQRDVGTCRAQPVHFNVCCTLHRPVCCNCIPSRPFGYDQV